MSAKSNEIKTLYVMKSTSPVKCTYGSQDYEWDNTIIKIGRTSNPGLRFKSVEHQSVISMTLWRKIEVPSNVENQLKKDLEIYSTNKYSVENREVFVLNKMVNKIIKQYFPTKLKRTTLNEVNQVETKSKLMSIGTLIDMINNKTLTKIKSQRNGNRHTSKQVSSTLNSIFKFTFLNSIVAYKRSSGVHELIDGQQRILCTLYDFISGNTPLDLKSVFKELTRWTDNPNDQFIYYNDLHSTMKENLLNKEITVHYIDEDLGATESDAAELFLIVNSATMLNGEEKKHGISDTTFMDKLKSFHSSKTFLKAGMFTEKDIHEMKSHSVLKRLGVSWVKGSIQDNTKTNYYIDNANDNQLDEIVYGIQRCESIIDRFIDMDAINEHIIRMNELLKDSSESGNKSRFLGKSRSPIELLIYVARILIDNGVNLSKKKFMREILRFDEELSTQKGIGSRKPGFEAKKIEMEGFRDISQSYGTHAIKYWRIGSQLLGKYYFVPHGLCTREQLGVLI